MLGIVAADGRARGNHGHRLIHTGVFVVEGAGQACDGNDIPRQNALLHHGVDGGGGAAVIEFVLRRHGGGDRLFLRGKRPGGGGVLVVGHACGGVPAGLGGSYRGRTIANDDNLPALLVHRSHIRAIHDLPADEAVARAAGGAQGKLIPVGDGIGLFGDGQGILGPMGDLERNFHLYNVIVAARFIGDDRFCRVVLGAHISVVDILELVLGIRQDGVQVLILDRDRRPLISAVIQVCVIGQGDHRRELFAQDFHAGDLGGVRGEGDVVVGHIYGVPDMILPRAGAGGDVGGEGAACIRRKFDLQAVAHRRRDQRAPGDQRLVGAVVSRLYGNRSRGNRADFANGQRDRVADRGLEVWHLREAGDHVIGARVLGQAAGVVRIPLLSVRILEISLQVVYRRYNIDFHRRQVPRLCRRARLHRRAVVVHLYWNGFGRGIPGKARLILLHSVSLDKGSVEGDAGDRYGSLTGIGDGVDVHRIVRSLQQLPARAVGQSDGNPYILRLNGAVIDQIRQIVLVNNHREAIVADASPRPILGKVERTGFRAGEFAGRTSPCVRGGACAVRVASIRMVCALADGDRLSRRHLCRRDAIAGAVITGIARLQQSAKIAIPRPNRGNCSGIGAGGEVYLRARGHVQGIRGAGDGYTWVRDAQETARLNFHTRAVFGDDRAGSHDVQYACPGDLDGI